MKCNQFQNLYRNLQKGKPTVQSIEKAVQLRQIVKQFQKLHSQIANIQNKVKITLQKNENEILHLDQTLLKDSKQLKEKSRTKLKQVLCSLNTNSFIRSLFIQLCLKCSQIQFSTSIDKAIAIVEQSNSYKTTKYKKLRQLYTQVSSKQKERQQTRQIPFFIKRTIKKFLEDYIRQINFFLMSTWIISFFLAEKVKSKGIDVLLGSSNITFREFIWWNACLTLTLSIIFCLFNISLTKLWTSNTPENYSSNKVNQQKSRQNQVLEYLKTVKLIIVKIYQVIMTVAVLLVLFLKVCWIVFGIFLFLGHLDFAQCSEFVVGYCLIEFVVFFSYGFYLLSSKSFEYLNDNASEEYQDKQASSESSFNKSEINQQVSELKQKLKNNTLLYVNSDDFQYLVNKLLFWSLCSFIVMFVLCGKDPSKGIQKIILLDSITYRNWMLIDGLLACIVYLTALAFWAYLNKKGYQFPMLRHEEKGLFYIESKCFFRNNFQLFIFSFAIISKIVLLFVGLWKLYEEINFEKCTSVLIVFLIVYFTQNTFLIIESSSIFRNGQRSANKLLQEAAYWEQKDRSSQQNIQSSVRTRFNEESKEKSSKQMVRDDKRQKEQ